MNVLQINTINYSNDLTISKLHQHKIHFDHIKPYLFYSKMSYHIMGGNRSSYEPIPSNYQPNNYSTHNIYPPPTQNTSIALFHIPQDATNSLYVDGIPNDASEREVSHIFRPFPGFQCIRLIKKTTMSGREYLLCFVDFQNVLQSTIALNTLQDYRFDKHDKQGLKISYAKDFKQISKQKSSKKYR